MRAKRAYSGSIIAEDDYDGLFRRVKKFVTKRGVEAAPADGGNTTVHFYHAGWRIVETRNGSDQTTAQYVWGVGLSELTGETPIPPMAMDRNLDPGTDNDCLESGDERYTYLRRRTSAWWR